MVVSLVCILYIYIYIILYIIYIIYIIYNIYMDSRNKNLGGVATQVLSKNEVCFVCSKVLFHSEILR